MKTNILTLHKNAYLFHYSHTNFYFSKQQRARFTAIQTLLKENHSKELPYNLNERGDVSIVLDSVNILINDCMIQKISGEYKNAEIVNNRHFKDLKPFHFKHQKYFCDFHSYSGGDNSFFGKTFRSMWFEMFPDSLKYYRIHFNRNKITLISSNGNLYLADSCNYSLLTNDDVLNRLDVNSKQAKNLISSFLDYIKAA